MHASFEAYCKQKGIKPNQYLDKGIWLIYGDDQSGSMASSYVPLLAVYQGTRADAINKALTKNDENNTEFSFSYWSKNCWGDIKLAKELT